MSNINNNFSSNVKFHIYSNSEAPLEVTDVIGWYDYGLDAARNLKFHGTLNKVTKVIKFKGESKEYVKRVYESYQALGDLKLVRSRLKTVNNEVVWVQDDPVYADFDTYDIEKGMLSLNFYSNSLMTIIDSHEDDEFELERLETIENKTIDPIDENYVSIKGRSIQSVGQFKFNETNYSISSLNTLLLTDVISNGPDRHSYQNPIGITGITNITAQALFYDNSTVELLDTNVSLSINFKELNISKGCSIVIYKFMYNDVSANYDLLDQYIIYTETGDNNVNSYIDWRRSENININFTKTLKWNEGLSLGVFNPEGGYKYFKAIGDCVIYDVNFFEPSPSIRFMFYNDVLNRLMYILTGEKDRFVSNFLGRKEIGYSEDGEGGLIGFLSGLWMRGFTSESNNYKSPKISIKDALESISNCFNLGYGVETINNKEKLVSEKINYFYRDEIVGKFPNDVDEHFEIDKNSNYSRLEFNYEKSGGLDQEMGLDEPNVKSQFITPNNKTANKFIKNIKVRADEYKLEDLRRKSVLTNPNDSISGDEDNWFLDLKRNSDPTIKFEQSEWQDRLSKEPTGIHDPSSFRSMLFTPMTILHRFASNFNSGLYLYKEKFINFISSSSNRDLSMQFIGQDIEYKESDNVQIKNINRPIFKNEIVSFKHVWSDEIEDLIFGKTEVIINNQKRLIPNYYFKMEFTNLEGETRRGYYLSHEHSDNPTFRFQLANEEII